LQRPRDSRYDGKSNPYRIFSGAGEMKMKITTYEKTVYSCGDCGVIMNQAYTHCKKCKAVNEK